MQLLALARPEQGKQMRLGRNSPVHFCRLNCVRRFAAATADAQKLHPGGFACHNAVGKIATDDEFEGHVRIGSGDD